MALIITGETVPNSMAVELVTLTVTNLLERFLSRKYRLVSLNGFILIVKV